MGNRHIDFYRDYFNPLNFVASTISVTVITSFSRKTSPFVWFSNLGISTLIGLVLVLVYANFLVKLFSSKPGKLQIISKKFIFF